MWRRVEIENFRAFERFQLDDLGRVNLLVGENNSGKTTVLEAIDLLASGANPVHLWETLARRGEAPDEPDPNSRRGEVELTHLFHGRTAGTFTLRAERDEGPLRLSAGLTLFPTQVPPSVADLPALDKLRWLHEVGDATGGHLEIALATEDRSSRLGVPLGPGGRLRLADARSVERRDLPTTVARFLTTSSLSASHAAYLFGQIALEDDESTVLEALRTIEPDIERIALVSPPDFAFERGGLAVRLAGVPRRVPIGSLGDGIWRLLALTLCLVRAKGGVLLVDEIDTGLHYTVLSRMWTLLMKTAERLDVQVFATTHSRDCYESLAAICREEPEGLSRASIQRIERGKPKAVAFTEREIVLAAERGIEVR